MRSKPIRTSIRCGRELVILVLMSLLDGLTIAHGQFTYTNDNDRIVITGNTGSSRVVTIPASIDGRPVVGIGDYAFPARDLTKVTIPDSVTFIGEGAFRYCGSLTEVNVPDSVIKIGDEAFTGCGLRNVTLGTNVTAIGNGAFSYCTGLTNVVLPNSVTTIGASAFFWCSRLTTLSIPGSVKLWVEEPITATWSGSSKHSLAFAECTSLATVTIGEGVRSVPPGAFSHCSSLTSISLPGSITNIAESAFAYCTNLSVVTIPDTVTAIGGWAFAGCSSLSDVRIPDSVTIIGVAAFTQCSSLNSISVGTLNAFYIDSDGVLFDQGQTTLLQCPGAKSRCPIPNTVTNIAGHAFRGCSRLIDVIIPNSVTRIGACAFEQCSSLSSITVPGNVAVWGERPVYMAGNLIAYNSESFANCTKLREVVIADGVRSVPPAAFAGCASLTNISFPESLTSIGHSAFSSCSYLPSIVIPDGVLSIPFESFAHCANLTNVSLPASLTTIGVRAFYACTRLAALVIPASVSNIENEAFSACTWLKDLYFEGDAPFVDSLFMRTGVTVFYLPGTVGWRSTFGGRPTAPWARPDPVILRNSVGIHTNQFGFVTSWVNHPSAVVEACTNLAAPNWVSVRTNALTDGWGWFYDSEWTAYPNHFYRIRSP